MTTTEAGIGGGSPEDHRRSDDDTITGVEAGTRVPRWSWLAMGLLAFAVCGVLLAAIWLRQDPEQPKAVQDVSELAKGIDSLNGQVATLNSKLAAALASAQNAPDVLSQVRSRIHGLSGKVGGLSAKLATVRTQVGGPRGARLAQLQAQLETQRGQLQLAEGRTLIEQAKSELQAQLDATRAQLQAQIDALAAASDAQRATIEARIDDLRAELDATRAAIQARIDQSQQQIQARIDDIQQQIQQIRDLLTSIGRPGPSPPSPPVPGPGAS